MASDDNGVDRSVLDEWFGPRKCSGPDILEEIRASKKKVYRMFDISNKELGAIVEAQNLFTLVLRGNDEDGIAFSLSIVRMHSLVGTYDNQPAQDYLCRLREQWQQPASEHDHPRLKVAIETVGKAMTGKKLL